jgi:aldehyde dehydrogenase (NAD+)/aldehyde dehydrogenase
MLMELIGDILPAGVLNIVTGFGAEAFSYFKTYR